MNATGTDLFPLKFCAHRWVENVPVVQRVIDIWPNIKVYIHKVFQGIYPHPKTASYGTVVSCTKDPLMMVKFLAFLSIAKLVLPFLVTYQTDKPMMPFIAEDRHRLLSGIVKRFVKEDVDTSSINKLMQLDPKDKKIHRNYSKVDLGFAADQELKKIKSPATGTSVVSDRQIMELRLQCRLLAKNSC